MALLPRLSWRLSTPSDSVISNIQRRRSGREFFEHLGWESCSVNLYICITRECQSPGVWIERNAWKVVPSIAT